MWRYRYYHYGQWRIIRVNNPHKSECYELRISSESEAIE
ncbi:hypothetical protein CSC18_1811 [Klebsiella aerogenes]|nr:hypothetical protein CSC18_1811 [Klebsiella aerogenes]